MATNKKQFIQILICTFLMVSTSTALKIPEPEDIIDAPEKTVIKIDEGAVNESEIEVSKDVPVAEDQPPVADMNDAPVGEAFSEVTDAPVEVPNEEALKSFDAPVDVSNDDALDEVTEAHLAQKIDIEQVQSESDSQKDVSEVVADEIKPETPIGAVDNVEIKSETEDKNPKEVVDEQVENKILEISEDEDAEIISEIKASDSDELKTEKTELAEEKAVEESDSVENLPEAEVLKNAPLEEIPVENIPAEAVAVENLPSAPIDAKNTPIEDAPLENTKNLEVETDLMEQNLVEQAHVEQGPVEQVPAENVPDENAPIVNIPVDNSESENQAPFQNIPLENIPSENISAEKSIIEHFEENIAQNDDLLEEAVKPVNVQNIVNVDEVQAEPVQVEQVLAINNNLVEEKPVFKQPEILQPLIPNAYQQSDHIINRQMNQPINQQMINQIEQNIPQKYQQNHQQNQQQNYQQNPQQNVQQNFPQYRQQNQPIQPLIPNAYQNSQHDSQVNQQQQFQNIGPVQQQPNQYNSNQYQQLPQQPFPQNSVPQNNVPQNNVPQNNVPQNNVPQNNIPQNSPNFVQNLPIDAEPKFDAVPQAPSNSLDGLIPIPSNNQQADQNTGYSDNFNLEPVQPPSRQGLHQPKPNLELNNDQIAKLLTMNAAEQKKYLFEIAENENHQDDFESLQRSPVRVPGEEGGQQNYNQNSNQELNAGFNQDSNQDANQDERLSFEDNNLAPVEENNRFMQGQNEEDLMRDQNEKLVEQPFGQQPKFDEPSYNKDQPVNMDPNIQAGENPYGAKEESPYEVNNQFRDDKETDQRYNAFRQDSLDSRFDEANREPEVLQDDYESENHLQNPNSYDQMRNSDSDDDDYQGGTNNLNPVAFKDDYEKPNYDDSKNNLGNGFEQMNQRNYDIQNAQQDRQPNSENTNVISNFHSNNHGYNNPPVETLVEPTHGSMKLFLVSLVLILGLAWINRRAIVGAMMKRSGVKRSRKGTSGDGACSTTSSMSGWGEGDRGGTCTQFWGSRYAEPVNKGQYVKLNIDAESQEEAGSGWDEDDADWDKW